MKWTLILTILVGFFQLICGIMPLTGKISDLRRRPYYKILTWRGWVIVTLSLFSVLCTITLFIISENESDNKDQKLKNDLLDRDIRHEKAIVNAGKDYIDKLGENQRETAEALAKYGLKYDATKDEIVKIAKGDTLRYKPEPIIQIAINKGISVDSIYANMAHFKVRIENRIAPAKNVDLKYYLLSKKNKQISILNRTPYQFLGKDADLDYNTEYTEKIKYPYNQVDAIYIYLCGTFKNSDGKKYTLSQFYVYDFNKKDFGLLTGINYEIAVDLLIKQGIYRKF
ncbi:hypothetical protein ACX0HA_14185 [Flavobacterium hauense]